MPTVLKLKNITKEFIEPRKNIVALNNINFDLSDGQCICLLGPSGSGKTTLLQIAGLLDSPTKGEIIINGKKLLYYNSNLLPISETSYGSCIFKYCC